MFQTTNQIRFPSLLFHLTQKWEITMETMERFDSRSSLKQVPH